MIGRGTRWAALAAVLSASAALAGGGSGGGTFERIWAAAPERDGVREISYEQFTELRKSGEEIAVLDVLDEDSFREGHIEGARNLPLGSIAKDTAGAMLGKDARVVVYCGSFLCKASTAAAKKLSALGYRVLDYKGGLKEWKEKGNAPAR